MIADSALQSESMMQGSENGGQPPRGWALRMGLAQNLEGLSLRKMGLAQKWDCGICQATDRLHLSLSRRLGWPLAAI